MTSKFKWQQVPRKAILAEAAQLLLALAAIALGWLTFPLLYALVGVEVVLVVAISARIYGRSLAHAAFDALRSLALWLFCGVFAFASYSGAGGFEDGIRIEPQGFAVVAVLIASRLVWAALEARASRDPRLHWTREVAMRGAVLALSLFFGAFACFIPGVPIAAALKAVVPELAADVGTGFSLLAAQAFLGCVVATMTPAELAAVSRQPYQEA